MDKKGVVHIHNGVLAIKKNAFESVLMRWMKLEPIIKSDWRRKWQPTPVFLPGESQGRRSLVAQSDTTERLSSSSIQSEVSQKE